MRFLLLVLFITCLNQVSAVKFSSEKIGDSTIIYLLNEATNRPTKAACSEIKVTQNDDHFTLKIPTSYLEEMKFCLRITNVLPVSYFLQMIAEYLGDSEIFLDGELIT